LPELTFRPLTACRWNDLVALFGGRGACAGCWCMWWRLLHAQFVRQKGPGNKRALHKIVDSGAAVEHARQRGARIVEAYPVDSTTRRADMSVYTGLASTFRELGFTEVARRSPTRPIMRLALR